MSNEPIEQIEFLEINGKWFYKKDNDWIPCNEPVLLNGT